MTQPRMRLAGVVLNAPDPRGLAAFYARLLEWTVVQDEGPRPDAPPEDGWVQLRSPSGGSAVALSFQFEEGYVPPVWPSAAGEQQMMAHLDIAVEDLDAAVAWAIAAGAAPAAYQPQRRPRDARPRRAPLLPVPGAGLRQPACATGEAGAHLAMVTDSSDRRPFPLAGRRRSAPRVAASAPQPRPPRRVDSRRAAAPAGPPCCGLPSTPGWSRRAAPQPRQAAPRRVRPRPDRRACGVREPGSRLIAGGERVDEGRPCACGIQPKARSSTHDNGASLEYGTGHILPEAAP